MSLSIGSDIFIFHASVLCKYEHTECKRTPCKIIKTRSKHEQPRIRNTKPRRMVPAPVPQRNSIQGIGTKLLAHIRALPKMQVAKPSAIDWSTINKELGWKPENNFDEYLKLTIDWYKNNQDWWKKIK
ncbi:MAG: dTDP-glucose 4,6-dehydratase, partial [Candidatus Roizmanbacteria bacterium GW2011_GWA2_32_13]